VEVGVTVGEEIADARGAAGLSVDEVSERTRIRETVIRSIERNDFDALGGDLYVRGYLRAIAGAVGIDAQPLIREFDATRGPGSGGWPAIATTRPAAGPVPAEPVPAGPAAVEYAAEGPAAETVPAEIMAAEPGAARPASTEPPVAEPADRQDPATDAASAEQPAVTPAGPVGDPAGEPAVTAWQEAGDHPTTVDEIPVYVDQPTTVDEIPVFVDEPTVADVPVAEDSPTLADTPVAEDPPTLVDIPVVGDAPTCADSGASPPWSPAAWNPGSDDYVPFWADDAVSDADPLPVGQPAFDEATVALGTGTSAPAAPAASGTRSVPARTGQPTDRRSRVRGWRWAAGITALVIVVLGVVGIASGQIVAKLRHTKPTPATTAPAVPARTADVATPSPTPTPLPTTPSPAPKPTAVPARALAVRSAMAYGPGGTAHGDHPDKARNVLIPGTGDPWQTDWYATAKFGMLQTGTGLLLDMGRPVTVTSLRIRLDSTPGASLQIRVGNSTAFSETTVRATAQGAGGILTLHLRKPTHARYVLIWITRLPPSAAGQFRETVYSVAVAGRP
jgi:cytoskeletal protein RodZ